MTPLPPPFPRGLRSAPRRTGSRRWPWLALAPAVVPLLLLLRVGGVVVEPCRGLPAGEVASLRALVGTPVVMLDLDEIRSRVQNWPGVAAVEVQLRAPARLAVTAHAASEAGSLRVGNGWHAVGTDGRPGRPLDGPWAPVLERFPPSEGPLRGALAVAGRLAAASGQRVLRVRRVMPGDLEVVLGDGRSGGEVVVHVAPAATDSERAWCALARSQDGLPAGRVDLTAPGRMVVGGRG